MNRRKFLGGGLLGLGLFIPNARKKDGEHRFLVHYEIYCSCCGHTHYDRTGKASAYLDEIIRNRPRISRAGRLHMLCPHCRNNMPGTTGKKFPLIVHRDYVCRTRKMGWDDTKRF